MESNKQEVVEQVFTTLENIQNSSIAVLEQQIAMLQKTVVLQDSIICGQQSLIQNLKKKLGVVTPLVQWFNHATKG